MILNDYIEVYRLNLNFEAVQDIYISQENSTTYCTGLDMFERIC